MCALLGAPLFLNAQNYLLTYSPDQGEALRLEAAIRLGIENNTELLRMQQNILITEQRVREQQFFRFPQISLLATASVYNLETPMVLPEDLGLRLLTPDNGDDNVFFGAGVIATQYLYSGGRISGAIKIAKANLKEEQSRYDTVKNNTVLEVKNAFFNLLYAREARAAAQSFFDKAASYRKNLSLSRWDALSADSVAERARAALNAARSEESAARLQMTRALNRELNSPVNIEGELKPEGGEYDIDNLKMRAMEYRPEMRAAIYELAAQDININLSSARTFPDVILGASYERVGEDNLRDTNAQASIAVRLPISYSFASLANQKRVKQKENYLRRASIEDSITLQVAESYDNYAFWREEAVLREAAFTRMKAAFTSAEKNAGVSLSALNALEEFYKTNTSYLNALKENNIARARLEWAIGQDL